MVSMPFICFIHLKRRKPFIQKICWHQRATFSIRVCDLLPENAGGAVLILKHEAFFLPDVFKSGRLSLTNHPVRLSWQANSLSFVFIWLLMNMHKRPDGCGGNARRVMPGGTQARNSRSGVYSVSLNGFQMRWSSTVWQCMLRWEKREVLLNGSGQTNFKKKIIQRNQCLGFATQRRKDGILLATTH